MNVLLPTTDLQELVFIPRFNAQIVTLELVNEFNDSSVTQELIADYQGGYMTVEIGHNFEEGQSFAYEVTDLTGELMYRGKLFITDQSDLQNYQANTDFNFID